MSTTTIPKDFQPQSANSNYLRLIPGSHRIRILSSALTGYSWWTEENDGSRKPHRIPMDGRPPVEFADSVRKFVVFVIYNYEFSKIQIWEITQSSIQQELVKLEKDKDWGSLLSYDIEIERTGSDKNTTRYRVTPKPKSEPSKEIEKAVKDGLPALEALYVGADPFSFNPNAT